MKSAKPTAITIIIIILLASAAYWLWQRQPKPPKNETPKATTTQKATSEQAKAILEFTPTDGQVLTDTNVAFNGKSVPDKYVIAYSNSGQAITMSSNKGNFKLSMTLADSLNLITISTLDENFVEKDSKPIVLYLNADKSASYKAVFAGSVKSIFDNLLTITTASGEKTFRQKTTTKLILPQNAKNKEDKTIRVGDYIIALGSLESEKEFSAESMEVIRENKPQNTEKFTDAIILSNAQKNPKVKDQILFSAKNLKENSAVDLILGKGSKISDVGKDAKEEKIVKDRKALIFFHQQDKDKIADLVYLLP